MGEISFLDVLERVDNESQSSREMFTSHEGAFRANRASRNLLDYKKKLLGATNLLRNVFEGKRHPYVLREVMTTDDFPILMGDILDRTLLAAYQEWPMTWTSYAKRAVVQDFRDAKLFPPAYGADGPLDIVPESDQYPDARIYEQEPILWHVDKYGRRIPFSWEAIVNDDLGQLRDMPARLARAARRTEHRLIVRLFVDANGPHASLFTVGNKNIINTTNGAPTAVGNNPPLTIQALQAAYTVLSRMTDESGEPIMREMVTLVVPPALEVTAMNILNAITINTTATYSGGNPADTGANPDTGYNELVVNNWMRGRLRLEVDPYIPLTATSANGDTSWFLFSNPNTSREAIRIGFLAGHETPEIWMKSPNAIHVGGGIVNPMEGDFDTDAVEYRVRHVVGATLVDPKGVVASNGSGS